jgi:hypothetical protein
MAIDRTLHVTAPRTDLLTRLSSRKYQFDLALGFFLTCGVFILYAQTLVPSVLDGDQGELQFMPAVLGIPHPSGFPLYVLLGHLWSWLPIGDLAYRMNLFSAFFGALTIGALYLGLRSQKVHLLGALGASLALAVMPQFWQYSTVAAVYRLHDFLIVLLFVFLAQWERTGEWRWLELAALAFGLDLANHLTILFFAPATAVLLLLVSGRSLFKQPRVLLVGSLLLVLPLILYLYFPLRGRQLLSDNFMLPGWNMAVAQGIVSPFYDNSLVGLLQYFVGGTFFSSITGHWQWKWDTLLGDWITTVLQTVNWQIAALSLAGTVWLTLRRARLAIWLIIVVLLFQLIALQYSYTGLEAIGQFSSYFREYYLPSFIALIILTAWGVDGLLRALEGLASRLGVGSRPVASAIPLLLAGVFLFITATDLAAHRSNSLAERSVEIQAKWGAVKKYPPDPGAALVGHWGDLTPLWYYQYAEGWRRDLVTINPPSDEQVNAWLATGKPLYLAGSLLDWAPGIAQNYRLTPWGPLVRVTRKNYVPPSPLSHPADWTFADNHPKLKLSGYDVSHTALRVGETLDVAAYWQVLDSIALDDEVMYLSLANAQDETHAQSYTLGVNWLPGNKLSAGQRALGTYSYMVPWGTPPGDYRLRLALYSITIAENLTVTENDQALEWVELGGVHVEPALNYPDNTATDHPANANFGNAVVLLGWDGELKKLAPGDSPRLQMLWKATTPPHEGLMAALSIENAKSAHPLGEDTLAKNYPSDRWHAGEIVRGPRAFALPADLPDGDYALVLRVREASKDRPLDLYDGWFPRGNGYVLAQVHVAGRAHSFAVPNISHPQAVNYDSRISMLGYELGSSKAQGGDSLQFMLYWQGQSLMNVSYKFFVHVVDEQGHILTQHDDIPGAGALPTTGWLPGEVVTDTFDLPLPKDAAPGRYQIQVGFYDSATGLRLNASDAKGSATQDHAVLDDALEVADK